jgi:hypothetical protein
MMRRSYIQRLPDRLEMKIADERQRIGLAAKVALALMLALLAGCSGMGEEHDENVPRLAQNRPTNVDLKHDLPVPRDKILYMEVDFAQRNQAEHDALSRAIDDKKSPLYHHWLTPEELHARFGETQEQFNAVEAWLQSQGFRITEKRYGMDNDYIKFSGTAEQAEQAFKIHLVEPMYDRYINSSDPALPPQFIGVISRVGGLYGLLEPGA